MSTVLERHAGRDLGEAPACLSAKY